MVRKESLYKHYFASCQTLKDTIRVFAQTDKRLNNFAPFRYRARRD